MEMNFTALLFHNFQQDKLNAVNYIILLVLLLKNKWFLKSFAFQSFRKIGMRKK